MSSLKDFFTAKLEQTSNPEFTAVFVRMWIAGTMGAYFTFLYLPNNLNIRDVVLQMATPHPRL